MFNLGYFSGRQLLVFGGLATVLGIAAAFGFACLGCKPSQEEFDRERRENEARLEISCQENGWHSSDECEELDRRQTQEWLEPECVKLGAHADGRLCVRTGSDGLAEYSEMASDVWHNCRPHAVEYGERGCEETYGCILLPPIWCSPVEGRYPDVFHERRDATPP